MKNLLIILIILFDLCFSNNNDDIITSSAHILMVSLPFRGHITPLTRLANELLKKKIENSKLTLNINNNNNNKDENNNNENKDENNNENININNNNNKFKISFAAPENGRQYLPPSAQLEFISLGRHPLSADQRRAKLRQISYDDSYFRGIVTLFGDLLEPYSHSMYPPLLAAVKREIPDLMIIDIGALAGLDIAHRFNIPYIINNPSLLLYSKIDNSIPALGSGLTQQMSIWERCFSLMYPRLLTVALATAFMNVNRLRRERKLFMYNRPADIVDGSIMLVNTAFGLEYPQLVPPNVYLTGPLMLSSSSTMIPPSLSISLKNWLEQSVQLKKPIIVILFGSGTMGHLSPFMIKVLGKVLIDQRFRVLWALKSHQKLMLTSLWPTLPSSFKVLFNFPQISIFSHTAVRLIISPCGLSTVQESLYYGKPLLCIPLLGDQFDVSARVADTGAGFILHKVGGYNMIDENGKVNNDYKSIMNNINSNDQLLQHTLDHVKYMVLQLYSNISYRAAATRVGNILRASGGTEYAANIVESVYKKNIKNEKLPIYNLSWYENLQLDILALLFSSICLILLFIRTMWLLFKWCFKYCLRKYLLFMNIPLINDEIVTSILDSKLGLNNNTNNNNKQQRKKQQ